MKETEKRLLEAIFETDGEREIGGMPDNYPDTVIEKVGYSQYSLASDLAYIGKALNRLGTVYNLLGAEENSGSELPAIILNNELRMALEPLMRVQADINDIVDWLLPIYIETKQGA